MPGSEVEDTDPAKLTVPLLVIMLIILALFYYFITHRQLKTMPGSEVEDSDPAKLTVPLLVIMLIILILLPTDSLRRCRAVKWRTQTRLN